MTAVFIHGVPETAEIWDEIRANCARSDTIALELPGFGTPLPDGFVPEVDATKEFYTGWIIEQLERIGEPIDLVGHDWGALLAQRVASVRPDLLRTWACGGGPIDATYVWHETAKAWQTPELGEQIMEAMTEGVLAVAFTSEVGATAAARMASHIDDMMKRCILTLYRSAIDVGAEWQPAVDALGDTLPAAVIWGANDIYAPPLMGERLATRIGASLHVLDCGHFWPLAAPLAAADALRDLWERA